MNIREADNLCEGMDTFTDAEFERNLKAIVTKSRNSKHPVVDFQLMRWFDLWSLIQLLFILEEVREKRPVILLLSPEAISPSRDDGRRELATARLKFLSDIGFLDCAVHIEGKLRLQTDRNSVVEDLTPDDIRQMVQGHSPSDFVSDSHRPIIPITRLEDLDVKEKADLLFDKGKEIFDEYCRELIVQDAGIGDCLLSELVQNVRMHANNQGYVALRAGAGLARLQRYRPEEYQRRLAARRNHKLADWRTYYSVNPDDGYFELIVADKGPGIAQTILSDASVSPELREPVPSLEQVHLLLTHALLPETSRLSRQERHEKDLTEFTGLGAIRYLLSVHQGSLLIREGKGRHIFGAAVGVDHKPYSEDVSLSGPPGKQMLHRVVGTALTVLVPTKRVLHGRSGSPTVVEPLTSARPDPQDQKPDIKVIRIKPSEGALNTTFLDEAMAMSWSQAAQLINSAKFNSPVVLLDIGSSSVNKNVLWTGLKKVYAACKDHNVALFLSGVNQRLASRIDDYAALDKKRIADGKDWLVIGLGDDWSVYCFGFFGNDLDDKHTKSEQIAKSLASNSNVPPRLHEILKQANYLEFLIPEYSPAERRFRTTVADLLGELTIRYGDCLKEEILQTGAWSPDLVVRLADRSVVRGYLSVQSVAQARELHPDLGRLLRIASASFDADFVMSVGTLSNKMASEVSRHIEDRELKRQRDIPVGYYGYHDYVHFDHGEGSRHVISEGKRVLLLLAKLRLKPTSGGVEAARFVV